MNATPVLVLVADGEGYAGPVRAERWLHRQLLEDVLVPGWRIIADLAKGMAQTMAEWEVPLSEVVWHVEERQLLVLDNEGEPE